MPSIINVLNRSLASLGTLPLDTASAAIASKLVANITASGFSFGVNAGTDGSSFVITTSATPKVTMTWVSVGGSGDFTGGTTTPNAGTGTTGTQVPIPVGTIEGGTTDHPLYVYLSDTDELYEFWIAVPAGGGNWTAAYGGYIANASTSDAVFPFPYGVAASGLSSSALDITQADALAGAILHTINFAGWSSGLNSPEVSPANRSDAGSSTNGVHEGQWLRFPASLTWNPAYGSSAFAQMVFNAIRDYGMICTDQAGDFTLQCQQAQSGTDHIIASFGGQFGYQVIANFPWNQLQVLKPPTAWPAFGGGGGGGTINVTGRAARLGYRTTHAKTGKIGVQSGGSARFGYKGASVSLPILSVDGGLDAVYRITSWDATIGDQGVSHLALTLSLPPPVKAPVPSNLYLQQLLANLQSGLNNLGTSSGASGGEVYSTIVVAASNSRSLNADFVCTGITDEATLNLAVEALPPSGGKIILLEGDYFCEFLPVAQRSATPVIFEGMGMDATTVWGSNFGNSQDDGPVFQLGTDYVDHYGEIRDMTVVSFANSARHGEPVGIIESGGLHNTVQRCRLISYLGGDPTFINPAPAGLGAYGVLATGLNPTIVDNEFYSGMWVQGVDSALISRNQISSNEDWAVVFFNVTNSQVSLNVAADQGLGILLEGESNWNDITVNSLAQVSGNAIWLAATSSFNFVFGNDIAGNTVGGVIDNGVGNTIFGNRTATGESGVMTIDGLPDDLSEWLLSGDGSPVGVVTPPQQGSAYEDLLNGGMYQSIGVTAADWIMLGGISPDFFTLDNPIPGVAYTPVDIVTPPANPDITIVSGLYLVGNGFNDDIVAMSDTVSLGVSGTLNGVFWYGRSVTGDASFAVWVGGIGESNVFRVEATGIVSTTAGWATHAIFIGSLPTLTITSGVGEQISTLSDLNVAVATTGAGTVLVELSPDDVTYSPLGTRTVGATDIVQLPVPVNFYLRLTAAGGAALGTVTTY